MIEDQLKPTIDFLRVIIDATESSQSAAHAYILGLMGKVIIDFETEVENNSDIKGKDVPPLILKLLKNVVSDLEKKVAEHAS